MLQITPQMKILAAVEPVDFRNGIDGLAAVCKAKLAQDPFSGAVFVFRNRRATALKVLVYDGQGFWLCQKRLSEGRFRWWPLSTGSAARSLAAHQLAVLFSGGNPDGTSAAPEWRSVTPKT
jgi:transposase